MLLVQFQFEGTVHIRTEKCKLHSDSHKILSVVIVMVGVGNSSLGFFFFISFLVS